MEFRLLELEDANSEKGPRDNLTDSDSGCVSPGSRIKDSASPELKRMDSGYKSPHAPSSPCNPRRTLGTPNDDFKEDFAKAQVLADILDRNSETSDSLKSNPVKDHLEQMILNAASAEDRSCLEQVLMLLYNLQALSSSVSEDECYQVKPKRICDLKLKQETDISSHKTHKAIATVTPYQQKGYKCESLESLISEERKPNNILQESGIFEGIETESRSTQTDLNESFESTELNTEIQRLNSIREKLERQGVRNRTLSSKEDGDGLECRCVKLGKKHKQYYERRLKFLEGKISIYEAAQDVKEAKLAQRLQKEFELENRLQELESELVDLHDKYDRLEEDYCELEEIENDTRLHWQQLEMDYELSSAQLRDMTEQRECSRGQVERLMGEISNRECALQAREAELLSRIDKLEKAVPALIAWNVLRALKADLTPAAKRSLQLRMNPLTENTKVVIHKIKTEAALDKETSKALMPVKHNRIMFTIQPTPEVDALEKEILRLIAEKAEINKNQEETKKALEKKVKDLEEELENAKRDLDLNYCGAQSKKDRIVDSIEEIEATIRSKKDDEKLPADPLISVRLEAMLANEKQLMNRVEELETREAAYLEMLTQADDMWAEMEGGYKKKIEDSKKSESNLKAKISKLEEEKDQWKKYIDPLRQKLKEVEESDSTTRIALEKAERDLRDLMSQKTHMSGKLMKADNDAKKAEVAFRDLESRFKKEIEELRKMNKQLDDDMQYQRVETKQRERAMAGDLETIRKELTRFTKTNQELDVTNSELREEEWQRAVSSMTYSVTGYTGETRHTDFASLRLSGNAGVLHGATRLASVSCACAAARLCAALPELADSVKSCQEEVLDHGDVKIMEEQLANAIESIVNCPSCALGTNAIVWSTDV